MGRNGPTATQGAPNIFQHGEMTDYSVEAILTIIKDKRTICLDGEEDKLFALQGAERHLDDRTARIASAELGEHGIPPRVKYRRTSQSQTEAQRRQE